MTELEIAKRALEDANQTLQKAAVCIEKLGEENAQLRQAIEQAEKEPLDTPLPCDVKVGHVTMRKGVALRTLVARMQVLYDMAQEQAQKPEGSQEPDRYVFVASAILKKLGIDDNVINTIARPTPPQQKPLTPVEGDLLPAIGSKVLIHLARRDEWVEHTVVGYYVWGDLDGSDSRMHRVFVRVADADGILNARMLRDVRPIEAANGIKE